MSGGMTLAELAERFSARLAGDGGGRIERVSDLATAGPGSIAFLLDPRYKSLLDTTGASAVILREEHLPDCPVPALVTGNPQALFARIAAVLHPDEDMSSPAGVHPGAFVDESAQVHASAVISANAVVEAGARIGAGTFVGPGTVVGRRVRVGAHCKLAANVTVCRDCTLGDRVIVHPGAVIGSDGFGLAREEGRWLKIPQLGSVIIGDDVEIGAGVAIDRGALRDTVIESGVKLDNQIHIAHNVTVGADTAMAAQSGVAGSTRIGHDCAIGGAVGILGHLEIAGGSRINAFSQVSHSITEPGVYASGVPLETATRWRRNRARFKQLDEMARRLKTLERRLEEIDKQNNRE